MKDIAEFNTGKFTDFEGKEHIVTVCAYTYDGLSNERVLGIGYSITNPLDNYNEEVGKTIAKNRAMDEPAVMCYKRGFLNSELVNSILKRETEYICNNPEKFIAGYAEAKERYNKKKEIENIKSSLSDNEKILIELLKQGIDLDKCLQIAMNEN